MHQNYDDEVVCELADWLTRMRVTLKAAVAKKLTTAANARRAMYCLLSIEADNLPLPITEVNSTNGVVTFKWSTCSNGMLRFVTATVLDKIGRFQISTRAIIKTGGPADLRAYLAQVYPHLEIQAKSNGAEVIG